MVFSDKDIRGFLLNVVLCLLDSGDGDNMCGKLIEIIICLIIVLFIVIVYFFILCLISGMFK